MQKPYSCVILYTEHALAIPVPKEDAIEPEHLAGLLAGEQRTQSSASLRRSGADTAAVSGLRRQKIFHFLAQGPLFSGQNGLFQLLQLTTESRSLPFEKSLYVSVAVW